jgi:hypothetical protein
MDQLGLKKKSKTLKRLLDISTKQNKHMKEQTLNLNELTAIYLALLHFQSNTTTDKLSWLEMSDGYHLPQEILSNCIAIQR